MNYGKRPVGGVVNRWAARQRRRRTCNAIATGGDPSTVVWSINGSILVSKIGGSSNIVFRTREQYYIGPMALPSTFAGL